MIVFATSGMQPADPGQPGQPQFVLQVPDDLEGGVYSNVVSIWHTPYEFTLDFAVHGPPQLAQNPQDGTTVQINPARVVSRVKVPPPVIFELMQALSQNESQYEAMFGPISRPGEGGGGGEPLFPPGS